MTTTHKKQNKLSIDNSKRETLVNACTAFGVVGAAFVATPFVKSMTPADNVKAQASTEVDLSDLNPGDQKTVMWRGKPVFIVRRTAKELKRVRAEDTAPDLLDPAADKDRTQKDEWLVVMAICTHLGCVPIKGGKHDGWRCPCHGSQFDLSGRLRQGPASTNLEIPPYKFLNDTTIKIG